MEELGLILTAIIVCSLLTALLTQLLGRLRVNRNMRLETILQEERDGRERISKLVVNSRHAFDQRDLMLFNRISAELRVRLDPDDAEDAQILALSKVIGECWDETLLEEFQDRISYRLQYDWDRTRRTVSSSLFYRYLFVLSVVFYATAYAYIEGMLGLNPELAETIEPVHLMMGGSIFVISLWLVMSFLGGVDNKVLSLLLGNPVRRRYRKRTRKEQIMISGGAASTAPVRDAEPAAAPKVRRKAAGTADSRVQVTRLKKGA